MRYLLATIVLALLSSGSNARAAEPGGNGRIVYSTGGTIWTMDPDGSGKVQLTATGYWAPSWSPDGTKIAYLYGCSSHGIYCLATMDADGRNRRHFGSRSLITYSGMPDDQPTWSPDGSRLAVTFSTSAGKDVFVVDASLTGSAKQITFDGASHDPDWGRNGKIAFIGPYNSDGAKAIWTVNPDTGERSWRVTSTFRLYAPDWRGETLAFASRMDVYLDDRQGSFGTPDFDDHPVLSPDGTAVAFFSSSGGRYGIWVQSLAGGPPTRLADSDAPFDWQAVAPTRIKPVAYQPCCQ